MRQDGEPTIEELLESIKRVIAREDRRERLASAPAEPSYGEPAYDAPVVAAADTASARDNVLDLAQHDYRTPDSARDAEPLVAAGASASMRSAFDTLAAVGGPEASAPVNRESGSALEQMVRELLRPALSDWLDRNLPAIVERMVAAEIARIAQRR
jgi:hypothetical protein